MYNSFSYLDKLKLILVLKIKIAALDFSFIILKTIPSNISNLKTTKTILHF